MAPRVVVSNGSDATPLHVVVDHDAQTRLTPSPMPFDPPDRAIPPGTTGEVKVVSNKCSCLPWLRPRRGKSKEKQSGRSKKGKNRRRPSFASMSSASVYHDADDGTGFGGAYTRTPSSYASSVSERSVGDHSWYYFDALEEELGSDEELYPIITTNYKRQPVKNVSFMEPESMLKKSHPEENNYEIPIAIPSSVHQAKSQLEQQQSQQFNQMPHKLEQLPEEEKEEEPFENKKRKQLSVRFDSIIQRPAQETMKYLESPRIKVEEHGYPGELSVEELQTAERFIHEIKERDVLAEIVFSLRDIEDEPYSICRFLRATKFDCDKMIERLEGQRESWVKARNKKFYPDVSEAIGAPFDLFLSQYPFISIGNAKNGCPVNYFRAGRIQPEGILCLTNLERMEGYFWNGFMFRFVQNMQKAQNMDPRIVRCEGINIIDLEGLSSSALTKDTFDVISLAGKIADFFPETLHCMLILNAPSIFSASWPVIKKLIDPRTAKRIHVYSNKSRGLSRLRDLIDKSEVPSDYGGSGKSIADAVMEQGGLNLKVIKRQEVFVLYIKRKGGKVTHQFTLDANEKMSIKIYTRSTSSAKFRVYCSDKQNKGISVGDEQVMMEDREGIRVCSQPGADSSSQPIPCCSDEIATVVGPGNFIIEGKDLDDASKQLSYFSRGYFLFAGNVKYN